MGNDRARLFEVESAVSREVEVIGNEPNGPPVEVFSVGASDGGVKVLERV